MTYPYDPGARQEAPGRRRPSAAASRSTSTPTSFPGCPRARRSPRRWPATGRRSAIKTKLIPVDYPAFRKNWVDRKTPGAVGYFNIANRDWIGTYALLEKQAYSPSKPNDTVNDPEVDGMIAQVMRQTDREKINALMRNIYTRLRSEHSRRARRLPALALRDVEDARQVEPGHRDVRPLLRRARRGEVESSASAR